MRPVTSLFLRALRQSHVVVTGCDVYFPGSSIPVPVPLAGGQLTLDRGAAVRRSGSLTIPWSLRADLGMDLRQLAFGGYVVPKRGVRYADGSSELVTLGRLRVGNVAWNAQSGVATLQVADRMAQVRDEAFLAPYVAAGKRPAQAAFEIVQGVFGNTISYRALIDPATPLTDTVFSGSRGEAVSRLADAFGGEAYFDGDGNFVFDGAPGAVYINLTGTLVNGSPVVTVASTVGVVAGMTVSGPGVPAGYQVLSATLTTVTMTGPASLAIVKTATGLAGELVLTGLDETATLTVGMSLTGRDKNGANPFQAGSLIASIDSPSQVTLTKHIVTTLNMIDQPLTVSFLIGGTQPLTFSGAADPTAAPTVWTVDAGENGVLVDAAETLERSGVYNGVLVNGQPDAHSAPITALVVVTDVTSPLLWGGPFGKVVRVEQSTAVQTVGQAQAVGLSLLSQSAGLSRSLGLTAAPNPALEPGDLLQVIFADGRVERHIIDSIGLDLGPAGAQTIAARSVWTSATGPTSATYVGEQAALELAGAVAA